MAEGWRERTARTDEFGALLMYQHERTARTDEFGALLMYQHADGRIEYVDEPPIVTNIADEVLRLWGCADSGLLTVHAVNGPLVYDVIGYDPFRNSWIAIRVRDD